MPIDPELYELFGQTVTIRNPLPITSYVDVHTAGSPPAAVGAPVLDVYGRHGNPLPDGTANASAARLGDPVEYRCRIEYSTRVIVGPDGRDRVSSGRIYLMGVFPEVSTESLVELDEVQPALRHPTLINVTTDNDQYGPHNTTIHFE